MSGSKKSSSRRRAKTPIEYPHSPLVEVAFEIRFPGEPAVECHRDRFYDRIKPRFPNVWVPNFEPGQPMALQPYHFKSQDGSETVMVALNKMAYTTTRYAGFQDFGTKAESLTREFCRMYGIRHLKRIGLRYINIIPFVRQGGVVPWKQHFNIEIVTPTAASDDLREISLAFEARCATGSLTTRIGTVRHSGMAAEAFLLDFDFAETDNLRTDRIGSHLDASHANTKRVFETIVSDGYKAVMRGEVVK